MPNPKSPFRVVVSPVLTHRVNRRRFIYSSAIAACALTLRLTPASAAPKYKSPNEKLDLGCIGVGGSRGAQDVEGVSGENIVALCDVDSDTLNKAAKKFPGARLYSDYRKMIENEKTIDGYTVTIPDHQHAPAAMRAIKAGKHVYVEKPLTHTIAEARQLRLAAAEAGVATQMGNQGHSSEGIRRLCEMIWADAIGQVHEVHCWTDRAKGWWAQGRLRPTATAEPPANLNWDLWLGPAPVRPFLDRWPDGNDVKFAKNVYHPAAWRGWWDFGCGALGDMACHIVDCPDWALKLGQPSSVEVVNASDHVPEMAPLMSVLKYEFPARGPLAPVTLYWRDSGQKPPKPPEMEAANMEDSGMLFIGDKGKISCGVYGANPKLLPESSMVDYKRPAESIPRVPGDSPYLDWIRACKGGPAACSNFNVSAPLTEWVLLGNVALRAGKRIEWDSVNMKITNDAMAQSLVSSSYRPGWEV